MAGVLATAGAGVSAELRLALDALRRSIEDEGPSPRVHRQIMENHRREWPTLHRAVVRVLNARWPAPVVPEKAPGWHPDTDEDVWILRAELDACRAEIARLRREVARLEGER